MGHAQPLCRGALKRGHRPAQDELLGLQHMAHGFKQFGVQRAILALQVQHGHRLGGWGGIGR